MRAAACVLIGLIFAGCELAGPEDGPVDYGRVTDIRYTRHVQPLLDRRCTSCHAGSAAAAGLRLESWSNLTAGSRFGEAVIPFDARHSRLLSLTTKRSAPHPHDVGADTLTRAEADFLARWINEGARNDAGAVPHDNARQLLYVCNQDAALVSVIDMETNLVIRTVDLQQHGFSANAKPHHVAVEPDGSFWYVSLIGDGKVAKFDRANRLVATTTMETPGMLAVHPGRDLLVVGRSMSAVRPPASLGLVRRTDLRIEEAPVVFPRPHAVALSLDGRFAYTASVSENRVMTVDLDTRDVAFTSMGAGMAQSFVQFAVAPDGRRMALTAEMADLLHVFDLSSPGTPVRTASVAVNERPWHPAYTPDGKRIYLGNKGAHTVTAVDAASLTVTAVVSGNGLSEPHGLVIRPDGRYVYVSNNNTKGAYVPRHDLGDNRGGRTGTVVVIDAATNQIVRVLEVGANPTGMGR